MEKAAFRLDSYRFIKASLDFNKPIHAGLNIVFNPKGVYYAKECRYMLAFDVVITCEEKSSVVAEVSCEAFFTFKAHVTIDEIPDYFYPNSIAILFPYIRAFVSTMSLQANVQPIMLPTINLTGLTEELKKQTQVVDD